MTRILFFILFIVAVALGLAWLADRPGMVTMEWLGYQIETSAFVATLVFIALAALLFIAFALLRYIWTRPAAVAAYMRERKKEQGHEALSRGLLAIGVGDRALAQRYSGIANRNLPAEPLTALLRAQTAQLKGDRVAARRAFEKMLDGPETQLLGVRGLFLEAQRSNDADAAQTLAEQAVERDPKLAWGVNALLDIQARNGDWEGALKTLAIARQNAHLKADVANRCRAVLLTAEAHEVEAFNRDKALTLANEALRLAPSLVPAGELAGRLLTSKAELSAASRLLTKTWRLSPHPDLAIAYAFAKPGLSPRERLKRVKQLADLTPGDIEGPIAVANAAVDAQDWGQARDALAPYLEEAPSARICTLMARVEAGALGDKGREREWLARAVRAPRDRAWIADGYVSDRWLPVSPVTGAIDAFEWKAPVDAIGRGDDTLMIEPGTDTDTDGSGDETASAEDQESAVVLDVTPDASKKKSGKDEAPRKTAKKSDKTASDRAAKTGSKTPAFVPTRAPDDPGVTQPEADESPTLLERLRAAQIR